MKDVKNRLIKYKVDGFKSIFAGIDGDSDCDLCGSTGSIGFIQGVVEGLTKDGRKMWSYPMVGLCGDCRGYFKRIGDKEIRKYKIDKLKIINNANSKK